MRFPDDPLGAKAYADRYVPSLSAWDAMVKGLSAEQAPSLRRGSLYAAVETVTGGCKIFRLHAAQRHPAHR